MQLQAQRDAPVDVQARPYPKPEALALVAAPRLLHRARSSPLTAGALRLPWAGRTGLQLWALLGTSCPAKQCSNSVPWPAWWSMLCSSVRVCACCKHLHCTVSSNLCLLRR